MTLPRMEGVAWAQARTQKWSGAQAEWGLGVGGQGWLWVTSWKWLRHQEVGLGGQWEVVKWLGTQVNTRKRSGEPPKTFSLILTLDFNWGAKDEFLSKYETIQKHLA